MEFDNSSGGFINSMCKEVELYKWDFGDGTELKQLDKNEGYKPERTVSHTYACPGEYDVTLYGYSAIQGTAGNIVGSECGSDNTTKQVIVLPIPELTKKGNISVCTGETVKELKLQDLDICTYDWYNKNTRKCEKINVCEILGEKVAYTFSYTITGDDIGIERGTFSNIKAADAIIPHMVLAVSLLAL